MKTCTPIPPSQPAPVVVVVVMVVVVFVVGMFIHDTTCSIHT